MKSCPTFLTIEYAFSLRNIHQISEVIWVVAVQKGCSTFMMLR